MFSKNKDSFCPALIQSGSDLYVEIQNCMLPLLSSKNRLDRAKSSQSRTDNRHQI